MKIAFYIIVSAAVIGLIVFSMNFLAVSPDNASGESQVNTQQQIPLITADKVNDAIKTKSDFILVDVRTPQEYQDGHIEGSTLIPLDTLQSQASEKLKDKSQPLYVYCHSGNRSGQAVSILKNLGYKNVFSMDGGTIAWQSAGYDLVK